MKRTSFDRISMGILAWILVGTCTFSADAFIFDDTITPWLRTASGRRSDNGQPATLTWSIVPDGTNVTDGNSSLGGSNLLTYLNENFGGDPDESDHTQQPWFSIFEDSFQRWDELSGLTFQYEPNDDGRGISTLSGRLGRRGDIRVSGASIDGAGGTLAFNFLPIAGSDMTIDTDESGFANSSGNYRFFRNTIMHELGHAFGLSHVSSDTDRLLMEPFTQTGFDGPQLDEIRAIQFFFGDAFEEANDGGGNGESGLASELGELRFGNGLAIGEDAQRASQRVSSRLTDFVSISNIDDVDFYSFTIDQYGDLSAVLTPHGGTFNQGSEFDTPSSFDADARVALSMAILDATGETILDEIDLDLGADGSLTSIPVEPGTYYARISGRDDTVQLYSLELELTANPGDFNLDGFVDSADFTVWRDTLGSTSNLLADASGNGRVDQADYDIWFESFGTAYGSMNSPQALSVPEPSTAVVAFFLVPLLRGWFSRPA